MYNNLQSSASADVARKRSEGCMIAKHHVSDLNMSPDCLTAERSQQNHTVPYRTTLHCTAWHTVVILHWSNVVVMINLHIYISTKRISYFYCIYCILLCTIKCRVLHLQLWPEKGQKVAWSSYMLPRKLCPACNTVQQGIWLSGIHSNKVVFGCVHFFVK